MYVHKNDTPLVIFHIREACGTRVHTAELKPHYPALQVAALYNRLPGSTPISVGMSDHNMQKLHRNKSVRFFPPEFTQTTTVAPL